MPDKWGRPTMHDFMALANQWTQAQEQQYLREERGKYQEYGKRLTAGEQVSPEEPGFNFNAFMKAQSGIAAQKLNNAQADKVIREQKQAQLDDLIILAEQRFSQGDKAGFWDSMAKTYGHMPDGNQIVGFSEDYSKMVIESPTGQRSYTQTPDPQKALQMAKDFSKKFSLIDEKATEKRREFNTEAFSGGGTPWVDSKGNVVSQFTFLGKNMEILETLIDPKTAQIVGGFDPKTEQYVEPQSDYRPWSHEEVRHKIADRGTKAQKDAAELEGINARTELSRAQKTKAEAEAAKAQSEDTAKADEQKRKKYKDDLTIVLKPFAGGAEEVYDEGTGSLTKAGITALETAQRLVGKYERKEPLTDDEKAKLPSAIQAWTMHQKMTEDIKGDYTKPTGASWRELK